MRIVGAAAVAAALLASAAPAHAGSARDYFVARASHSTAPQQLDKDERVYYVRLFAAIDGTAPSASEL